eukprot:TRINITY_DN39295_c0_g1_i1.p1 TRINITY_DN39295_c0_g1~~TRINITY_DN39295_c0_g1_i1.p1  ORF type:complete len:479 (+),score=107.59 TRINITY_DN39295_c0_g1_i1:64-1437(+)
MAGVPLLLASAAVAGVRNVTVFQNQNVIFGLVPKPGENGTGVRYLGSYDDLSGCEKRCVSDDSCHGFAWHAPSFGPPWALGCYGLTAYRWNPQPNAGVTSGKVGFWPAPGQCADASQCGYNGKCVDKKCRCNKGWTGTGCGQLTLQPSPRDLGYQGNDGDKVVSWGGSVLVGDDGTYHMYAAEIVGNCGMNVWLSNSRVIHATSPDPRTTPFKRVGVVHEVFAHEPIAARAPTGEYVVYFTATHPSDPLPVKGGKECTGCAHGVSPASCGTDANRNASVNLPTYMVYSSDPNGPWSDPVMLPGTDQFVDSNFAPVINADGSLVALERAGVVHGSHWKDVSTYKSVGAWQDAGEDPFVWRNSDGVYHGIVHAGPRDNTYGVHYYSTDGVEWFPSDDHAYTHRINFTDGTHIDMGCRERPHMVLDKNGEIVGLTNGAAPITCHLAGGDDYAYTSLQLVS